MATKSSGEPRGRRKPGGRQRRAGPWTRARDVLTESLAEVVDGGAEVEIGRLVKIGHGTHRDVYATRVDVRPDPEGYSGRYAVLLPHEDATAELDERTRREAALLQRIAVMDLPFRVPRAIPVGRDGERLALVRRYRDGVPLDMRAGQQLGHEPIGLIAELAATVHALKVADFADLVEGRDTRFAHAEACVAHLAQVSEPEAREAHAWALQHMPPKDPTVFLHGDLVGQNILLMPPPQRPLLLDWEHAQIGDPAWDLARVTRGARQPFRRDDGLERLIDAYNERAGASVTLAQARLYEMTFAARRYVEGRSSKVREAPEVALAQIRDLLDRAG